ncbi:hypothetical protein ABZ816_37250 [Actinosynnema sp. NPDC047251]|uniref:hypothetical protein n=1 Tax=Saccharothrix espanaensis TaxID=103731 RepID=UPI0003004129|nr:hypothetical protein [Saccharothrix espanaensis]
MNTPTPGSAAVVADEFRPKLRTDALWVPDDDGAFLLCNAASLTIRGKSSYALIDRIAPHLDGSATLGDLVRGLPPAVGEQVRLLVHNLHDAGFVRNAGVDRAHGLSARELTAYAGELAFIEYFGDSPAARYESFRDAAVLCVGSGRTLEGLVRALVQLGNRRTTAVLMAGDPSALGVRQVVADAQTRDPDLTVEVIGPDDGPIAARTRLAELVRRTAVVLHFADEFDAAAAGWLDEHCERAGRTVLHGVIAGDEAWLGPLAGPAGGTRGPDLWRRLRVTTAPSPFLGTPTARIVAGQLAFEAFKLLTGVPADDFRDRAVRIDLATLETEAVVLSAEAPEVPAAPGGWAASLPPDDTGSAAFSPVFRSEADSRFGAVGEVDEGSLAQVPLHCCRAAVTSVEDDGARVTAVGTGLDLTTARLAAVLVAAERACLDAVADARHDDVHAMSDLLRDRPVDVPRDRLAAWLETGVPLGVASGANWGEAALRAVGRLGQRALRDRAAPGGEVVGADSPHDVRLRRILAAGGHEVTVRSVLDEDGFAVARAESPTGLTGVGVAHDPARAATDALFDAACGLHETVTGQALRAPSIPAGAGCADEPAAPGVVANAARWLRSALGAECDVLAVTAPTHPLLGRVGRVCAVVVAASREEAVR